MAVYFLNLKTFGRSGGSSAISAAAYRAGERIHDERAGRTYDHTDRKDVLHKEIVLPSDLADFDMSWAKQRAQLWNAAEAAESRRNARVAREYLVALPVELDPEQRVKLARDFSQELVDRYRFALDLVVHAPRDYPGSDPRNFHAHLLATTREPTPHGLASKTTLEFNDAKRLELGLQPVIHELYFVRERWATVTNEALRQAHVAARVDHRSLAAQGIDREPYPHIPRAAFEMERHGYRSAQAERMRMEYQARVAARVQEQKEGRVEAPVQARTERDAGRRTSAEATLPTSHESQAAAKRPTLEEIRRQAREDWLRMRQEAAQQATSQHAAKIRETTAGQERSDDDSFSR
ncbi:MAG: MobA/MobL family protein [Pseudomonadota bacterium]|nr:MobA/MobL family protein [Pseudomonadota bacterium]